MNAIVTDEEGRRRKSSSKLKGSVIHIYIIHFLDCFVVEGHLFLGMHFPFIHFSIVLICSSISSSSSTPSTTIIALELLQKCQYC